MINDINSSKTSPQSSPESSVRLPIDFQQRIDALNPLRSICVTAPAGSGKTELLSQRVLKLLSKVDQPEEILAITFTRKAASEMHTRIIEALKFAETSPKPEQPHKILSWDLARSVLSRDKELGWQLLSNPNRLKIQTIDGLCSSLTRQMPILSNFGAQPKVVEQAETYYATAAKNLLEHLEKNNPFSADLITLLSHVDNDMQKVERLLSSLLRRRDQWLLHIGLGSSEVDARKQLESTLQDVIQDSLAHLAHDLRPMASEIVPLLDYAGSNMQLSNSASPIAKLAGILELPTDRCEALPQWLGIASLFLTASDDWRKSINVNSGFPTVTSDGDKKLAKTRKETWQHLLSLCKDNSRMLESLATVRHLPSPTYPDQQWVLLDSLTRLLPVLAAELRLVFQQYGIVDFIEISIAASNALGDSLRPTDLAMKLDYQLHHILIDEFQDTASTQYNLLKRLVEGWKEYNASNPDNPNTLFIVGDGMQSIYGFREANVGLFMDAKKNGVNGVLLDDLRLTVNFRSTPVIVDWVNTLFLDAFPSRENISRGAVPYELAESFNPNQTNSLVRVLGFSGGETSVREAEKLAKLIQNLQAEDAGISIAVLVRSRGALVDIIPALSRRGLNWSAKDINPLVNYSAVADLLSLTKALLNISDNISWAAFLRAPWIGLDNSDLYILIGGENVLLSVFSCVIDRELLTKLSPHGSSRMQIASDIILSAYRNRKRLDLRSWIEGIWVALGGASTVTCLEEYAYVDAFFDLLSKHQVGEGQLSLNEFENAIDSLYAEPVEGDSNLQIMTVHKSKGLEFDAVFLPGLARSSRSDDKGLLIWNEYISDNHQSLGRTGLVISPLEASGHDEDSIYKYLRYEQSLSSKLEETRLLYVAATRSITQLYILFSASVDEKTKLPRPPAKNSLLARVWGPLENSVDWDIETEPKNQQYGLDFRSDDSLNKIIRIEQQWRAPDFISTNPLDNYYLENRISTDYKNIPSLSVDSLPVSVGNICHLILEMLSNSARQSGSKRMSESKWLSFTESNMTVWLETLLKDDGLEKRLWPNAVVDIIENINRTLSDRQGRWILFGNHKAESTELKLLSLATDQINTRVIDRCFIDEKNQCWIVDYKTSRLTEGEPRKDFFERTSERYRNQLLVYRDYLSKIQPYAASSSIKMALYFTYYSHWLEVEDP
ncbi:MAG: ATP-dependent helicase/nuclease subunit A [Oceanicoccus sp.]|jgi:ATP-dependent helicase/nuclease subunit A